MPWISSSLMFVCGFLQPWEAYLRRYPTLPLVIIVGSDDPALKHKPKPSELEGDRNWRVVLKSKLNVWMNPEPLDMVVYERITPLS